MDAFKGRDGRIQLAPLLSQLIKNLSYVHSFPFEAGFTRYSVPALKFSRIWKFCGFYKRILIDILLLSPIIPLTF